MLYSQPSSITHAIPTEGMKCLKHRLLRGRALWACAIVYAVTFQPVTFLFREVSSSRARFLAFSLARSLALSR